MEKFFCLQNEKSVLTRDESAFIKGVLICLVVLWHNVFIASVFESAYGIFVPAHVSGFFLITFLYGYKKTNFSDFIIKLSKKIIPVYAIAFIICSAAYIIVYNFVFADNISAFKFTDGGGGGVFVRFSALRNTSQENDRFFVFFFFPSFLVRFFLFFLVFVFAFSSICARFCLAECELGQ